MYEIPWFKTETTIFSNRKIQIILNLPEGDTYFRVWIQLIELSVECNNKGKFFKVPKIFFFCICK